MKFQDECWWCGGPHRTVDCPVKAAGGPKTVQNPQAAQKRRRVEESPGNPLAKALQARGVRSGCGGGAAHMQIGGLAVPEDVAGDAVPGGDAVPAGGGTDG